MGSAACKMCDQLETADDIEHKVVSNESFILGCIAWSLRLIRNDFVFNNVFVASADVVVYRVISFMQRWAPLHKEGRLKVWLRRCRSKLWQHLL